MIRQVCFSAVLIYQVWRGLDSINCRSCLSPVKLRQIPRHGINIRKKLEICLLFGVKYHVEAGKNERYMNQYLCEHGSIRGNSNQVRLRHSCEHEFGISVSNFAST